MEITNRTGIKNRPERKSVSYLSAMSRFAAAKVLWTSVNTVMKS